MSLKKEQLKKITWRITEIYINAKENFSICYYLHQPSTTTESDYLQKDRYLKFIRHSLWRLSVIELSKLFSGRASDNFTLTKLINKLKPRGYFEGLFPKEDKLIEWEKYIESRSERISSLITLRDKIYAHTDPDKDDYKALEVYFAQVDELFHIVEVILIEIEGVVFDSMLDLRTPIFDRSDFDLVRILADHHQKRIEHLTSLIKSHRSG